MLDWLQTTNPCGKHNSSLEDHDPETSQWIHRIPEWPNWLSMRPSTRFLWIYGIPGCGKTVLASYLIEQVKQYSEHNRNLGYAYYYCIQNIQREEIPFLRWIVSQLCRQSNFVPDNLVKLHEQRHEPSIEELHHILEVVLLKFERAFIMLDAVDESQERANLINVLTTLASDNRFGKIQILATSRDYIDIRIPFMRFAVSIPMSNTVVESDIRLSMSIKLRENKRLQRWRQRFPEMEDALATRAQGM